MQITFREVEKLFGVSEKDIIHWIHDKHLPARKVNGQYRFNRTELLEWATTHGIRIFEPAIPGAAGPGTAFSLAGALEKGGIFHKVPGKDKSSALEATVDRLSLPKDDDKVFLLRMILAREAIASTGTGEGIAIPHPRNPIIQNISDVIVTLCFLGTPVEFGAIDDKPVHALFLIIAPNVKIHLECLSRLAFALQNSLFKEVVKRQGPKEEILRIARQIDAGLIP
jgi:PTS system nitrogen regulatory IIA component